MLLKLYSWLKTDQLNLDFDHQMISQQDFERERKQILDQRKGLLADLLEFRQQKTQESSMLIHDTAKKIEQHDDDLRFLSESMDLLNSTDPIPMPLLALKWLLSKKLDSLSSEVYVKKIKLLFYSLLKVDPRQAMELYDRYQHDQFDSLKTSCLEQQVKQVQSKLDAFNMDFDDQENPLSFGELLRDFVDDIPQFAAVILWLIQRKISVDEILSTGLLQDFMTYNLVSLNNSDDPLLQLYLLLGQFPEAQSLIAKANRVQCEDRGFHCEKGGGHSFSITGLWCLQKDLIQVEVKHAPLSFSITEKNFNILYRYFDIHFIKLALLWHVEIQNVEWGQWLRQWIHAATLKVDVLSKMIHFIAVECKAGTLEILTPLFDTVVLEKLLAEHDGCVLHFLPYHSAIRQKITAADTEHYLKEIMADNPVISEIIPQLSTMLSSLQQENNLRAAKIVYEVLLDLILKHPEYSEDRYLVKQLKSFPDKEFIFMHVSQKLSSEFDRVVHDSLSSKVLSQDAYYVIEDVWRSISRQLTVLQDMTSITVSFPSDKHKMQAHLAKCFFSNEPSLFLLDDFIQSLEIEPVLALDAVNDYERLLVDILTVIDDERIRNSIISVLETRNSVMTTVDGNTLQRLHWTQVEYGEARVLELAASQGNLGLVQWLIATQSMMPCDMTHAAMRAAQVNQWEIVDYLCHSERVKFDQDTLKELLILAASMGHLEMVKQFCEHFIVPLESRTIVQAFAKAADNCHLKVIEYFCQTHPKVLGDGTLTKTIRMAVQRERLGMIAFLGNLPKNKKISVTIESALVQEVVHDRFSLVQQLCHLQTNTPSQSTIEIAFAKAIKYDHFQIAQFFCELPQEIAPSQKAFDAVFDDCITNGSLAKIDFLCRLKTHSPSLSLIKKALLLGDKLSPLSALGLFKIGERSLVDTALVSPNSEEINILNKSK